MLFPLFKDKWNEFPRHVVLHLHYMKADVLIVRWNVFYFCKAIQSRQS